MCSYSDKVIKSLEPDNIKAMKAWNKKFTAPYDENDVGTLLRLSSVVDELWEAQVNLRKEVEQKTQDRLSIFGHQDDIEDSHTTIRQKDKILSELYRSEHMKNAGPYARLKFAMDYWCALWFWPIDKADLLPSRSEFFFDMSLILEGTLASVNVDEYAKVGQMSLFPTEMEQMAIDIVASYGLNYQRSVVDIPALRKNNPRLDLVYRIAEQNKFMHWELEFADLFAEKGGFDLILGNPPWIKLTWNEQNVLADKHPIFAIKKLSATQTAQRRNIALGNNQTRAVYFEEYESMSGQQSFLGAGQNYHDLKGSVNLFKCFLPQSWMFGKDTGVKAFLHPELVYTEPGSVFRANLYSRLKKHFVFANEKKLFAEVHNETTFSINIYSEPHKVMFDNICNLYDPSTIDECYEDDGKTNTPNIKDENGNWDLRGHKRRIVQITRKELETLSKIDGTDVEWNQTKMLMIHSSEIMEVLKLISQQPNTVAGIKEDVFMTGMWHETNSQQDGIIKRDVHFPSGDYDAVLSSAHINVANPLYQASKRICETNRAYDRIDLDYIGDDYFQRCNYRPSCEISKFLRLIPVTQWGKKITDDFQLVNREMVGCSAERTLASAIIPPKVTYVNTLFGLTFKSHYTMALLCGCEASVAYDFLVKNIGKGHVNVATTQMFPLVSSVVNDAIVIRALMLNCLTEGYAPLWNELWKDKYIQDSYSLLTHNKIGEEKKLSEMWNHSCALRSELERRNALVELDVLVAMGLGMTLDQLKKIYNVQFPVMKQYEDDTWYDSTGRVVFSPRSYGDFTYKRLEWERQLKDSLPGAKYERIVTDDTVINGPLERKIEFIAPFFRCCREQDYETAWKFFEEKYGKE